MCPCPSKTVTLQKGITSDTEEKQHRLRVNRETKTWVSTSGDRGRRAQAVKLREVLFGRTVGCIEQLKAT